MEMRGIENPRRLLMNEEEDNEGGICFCVTELD